MSVIDVQHPFYMRLWQYFRERFPLVKHGIAIGMFSFSAISYSRLSSGKSLFVSLPVYLTGFLMAFTFFLLLRLLDEVKDYEDDMKFRKYLPVPRGLIRLEEIRVLIGVVLIIQGMLIFFIQQEMLLFYLLLMGYLFLMSKEFFSRSWLRKHHLMYVISHMMIIPFVDMYSSGLDWVLDNTGMHTGLLWFFAVSFFNGIVLEFGRKMRTPEKEEPGVLSYTGLYGIRGGPLVWIALLGLTTALAIGAARYAGYATGLQIVFGGLGFLLMLPAFLFIIHPTEIRSKMIENASGIWTVMMYLLLGAAPMIERMILTV